MKRLFAFLLALILVVNVWVSQISALPVYAEPWSEKEYSQDGRVYTEDGFLVVPGGNEVIYNSLREFSGDYEVEIRTAVDVQAVGLMLGCSPQQPQPALWALADVPNDGIAPQGVWIHPAGRWTTPSKVPSRHVSNGVFVTMKIVVQDKKVSTYLNEDLVNQFDADQNLAGSLGLRFSQTESGRIDYVKVVQNNVTIFEDDFDYINDQNWNIPKKPAAKEMSADGRVYTEDGYLNIPGGTPAIYNSIQEFSGDYEVEIRAAVDFQAVGLMLGCRSGFADPALWALADVPTDPVAPQGVWVHAARRWATPVKCPSRHVVNGQFVTMRIEIKGLEVVTYLNNEEVQRYNMEDQNDLSGRIGLRFSQTESGRIDYVKVTQAGETVFADNFNFINADNWDIPKIKDSEDRIDEWMRPVWQGNTVYEESVWPIAKQDGSINDIQLLYPAEKIVTVQNLAHTITYEEGKDYVLADGKLRIQTGTSIPVTDYSGYYLDAGSFPASNGKYLYHTETADIINRQLLITYEHSSSWEYETPQIKSELLPNFTEKLENAEDVNIVYYGDSITEGWNVSSFLNTEPYMPRWSELVTQALSKAYPGSEITGINTGVAGQATDWGIQEAETRVNAYNPDLVVLAFGMNDATARSTEEYIANLKTIMERVKAKNPDCEFVIVTTTMCNPEAYTFLGRHQEYMPAVLEQLEGEGVAAANMTQMHLDLMKTKSYADMTGNNINHPNDFLARVYAQIIFETINGYGINGIPEYQDVQYVVGSSDQHQTLDVFLPEGDAEAPYPVVVYIHGGAWLIGDKTDVETQNTLNAFLEDGYAVVKINYRLAQNAAWPAQIYDCKAAIRYIRAHAKQYNINPDQIAVLGASAGGHLAQLMGTTNGIAELEDLNMGYAGYSSDVHAVISNYGISDISDWRLSYTCTGILGRDPVEILLGEGYTQEQAKAASAIHYVNENTVPMLLLHGRADDTVEFEQSSRMSDKLLEYLDIESVETFFTDEGGHGDPGIWTREEKVKVSKNFLQKQFRPTKWLDSIENTRPNYGTVSIEGYPNKYTNIAYASQDSYQKLHLVLPDNPGEDPLPLLVFVHGGGFAGGNSNGPGSLLFTAEGPLRAVERGYAVALVDYKVSQNGSGSFPQNIYDVKAAIRYLRANAEQYGLDSDKIAIWGESAGGHIVDFVGLTNNNPEYEDLAMGNADYSSEVQAVVSFYAITDMTTNNNAQYRQSLLGGNAGNAVLIQQASPLYQVTENAPPVYLQHGMGDSEVEYQDSVNLYERLMELTGNENNKLDLFPGIEHAVRKFIQEPNVTKLINWLDTVLEDTGTVEPGIVDKTRLEKLIREANDYNKEDYVSAGWSEFEKSLAEAKGILASQTAGEQEVKKAESKLLDAMMELRYKADKTLLQKAVDEAERLDIAQYTKETAGALQVVLAEARAILADDTLDDSNTALIKEMTEKVENAMNNLEKIDNTETDDESESESESETEPESESESGTETEPESESESGTETEPESELESETEPESESDGQPESESETNSQTEETKNPGESNNGDGADDNDSTSKVGNSSGKSNGKGKSKNPKTGDTLPIAEVSIFMVAAGAMLFTLKRKKIK